MGTVALIARVMPESPEVDLGALTAEIRKQVPGLQDVKEEPIGFGLKALKIAVIADDAKSLHFYPCKTYITSSTIMLH